MTIVNASNATEAVNITLVSNQFDFAGRDAGGNNSATSYSWLSTGGDDIQVTGVGIDSAGNPPGFGLATAIDIDLSNDDFLDPDVEITGITRPGLFGQLSTARLSVITASAFDFFDEIMALDDEMTGSAFDDTFKAGGGADVLEMGGGDDTAYGDDGDDDLFGEDGDDTLYGGAGADTLFGGDGDDVVNGGTGADAMNGGFGGDVYVVDSIFDSASEVAGGVDRVDSSVTHTLSANLENLTLTGASSIDGSGNFRANVINGNTGNNDLFGFAGNDTMNGGAGADLLDGGTGGDTMSGGAGNDIYIVDSGADSIFEAAVAGIDLVQSSVSTALSANVENLRLVGAGAISGTGNGLGNIITGNGASNVLLGLGGSDTLVGGGGADTLDGGAGLDLLRGGGGADILVGGPDADVFDFDAVSDSGPAAASRDVINGFAGAGGAGGDVIDVSTIDANAVAGGLQAFTWLGVIQNPFPPFTAPGSLWLRGEAGETIVYGNVDFDMAPEIAIRINDGALTPFAYAPIDFVL